MIFGVLAGVILAFQAGINAGLGKALSSPALATLASFCVGIAGLIVYILASTPGIPTVAVAAKTPWWMWIGGLLGGTYVMAMAMLVPKLGIGLTLAVTITGQLVMAAIIDHFGWLGPVSSFNTTKLAGIACLILGVVLVQKK